VQAVAAKHPLDVAGAGIGADDQHVAERLAVPGIEAQAGELGAHDAPSVPFVCGEQHVLLAGRDHPTRPPSSRVATATSPARSKPSSGSTPSRNSASPSAMGGGSTR